MLFMIIMLGTIETAGANQIADNLGAIIFGKS